MRQEEGKECPFVVDSLTQIQFEFPYQPLRSWNIKPCHVEFEELKLCHLLSLSLGHTPYSKMAAILVFFCLLAN